MLPIRYRNGSIPTNTVLPLSDLADVTDTVLDPMVEEFGGSISLPCRCLDWMNREIEQVLVPPFGAIQEGEIVVLTPAQGSAQSLLHIIDKFQNKEVEEKNVARSLIAYQRCIINQLFGRSGYISRHIMASRMKKSGRAVLLPRAGGDPCVCELPKWMMKRLFIRNNDYVLVGRDPTIWDGGVEILRAIAGDSDVIRLNPLVFKQLAADCIGEGTPIFLRHRVDNHHHIVYTECMSTTNIIHERTIGGVNVSSIASKDEGTSFPKDVETLDRNGSWVPVKQVLNKGRKKTLDIVTRHGGLMRLTPDHQVLCEGVWKKARDLGVGDVVDLGKLPYMKLHEKGIDTELMWALGLFCADGFAAYYLRENTGKKGDTRYEFRLTNNNGDLLKRAKTVFEDRFKIPMAIQQYKSEKPGAKHRFQTDKHISHLVVSGAKKGQKKDFVLYLLKHCTHLKEKSVPGNALSSKSAAQAWLDGFFAGDGRHGNLQEMPDEETIELTVSSSTLMMELPVLIGILGRDITVRKYPDRRAYSVRILSGLRPMRSENEVVHITDGPVVSVFDITTDGEFLAGRNVVHNCDGDQVYVLRIPHHLSKEAEAQLGSFMKRNATWPVPYLHYGEKVDWSVVEVDMAERAAPTGFSVSPLDIITGSEDMALAEKISGKELQEECLATASGLSEERWKEIVREVNLSQLTMKLGMGPVGAAAMQCRVLAGDSPRCRQSACLISERLEQKLLNSKKAKNVDDPYDYRTALDILNIRHEYSALREEDATPLLAKVLGLKEAEVRPMVSLIWKRGVGLSKIVMDEYPFFASTTFNAEDPKFGMLVAQKIFHHMVCDPDGTSKFIIETLIKSNRVEEVNAIQA